MTGHAWAFLAAALLSTDGAPLKIESDRLKALLRPAMVSEDPAIQAKVAVDLWLDESMSMPMSGLLLQFGPSGCLSAVVIEEAPHRADWNCLNLSPPPRLQDFVGTAAAVNERALILASPLHDLETVKASMPGRDEFWDEQKAAVDRWEAQIRQTHPGTTLYRLAVPF
jgi:hypothetical protein